MSNQDVYIEHTEYTEYIPERLYRTREMGLGLGGKLYRRGTARPEELIVLSEDSRGMKAFALIVKSGSVFAHFRTFNRVGGEIVLDGSSLVLMDDEFEHFLVHMEEINDAVIGAANAPDNDKIYNVQISIGVRTFLTKYKKTSLHAHVCKIDGQVYMHLRKFLLPNNERDSIQLSANGMVMDVATWQMFYSRRDLYMFSFESVVFNIRRNPVDDVTRDRAYFDIVLLQKGLIEGPLATGKRYTNLFCRAIFINKCVREVRENAADSDEMVCAKVVKENARRDGERERRRLRRDGERERRRLRRDGLMKPKNAADLDGTV